MKYKQFNDKKAYLKNNTQVFKIIGYRYKNSQNHYFDLKVLECELKFGEKREIPTENKKFKTVYFYDYIPIENKKYKILKKYITENNLIDGYLMSDEKLYL